MEASPDDRHRAGFQFPRRGRAVLIGGPGVEAAPVEKHLGIGRDAASRRGDDRRDWLPLVGVLGLHSRFIREARKHRIGGKTRHEDGGETGKGKEANRGGHGLLWVDGTRITAEPAGAQRWKLHRTESGRWQTSKWFGRWVEAVNKPIHVLGVGSYC